MCFDAGRARERGFGRVHEAQNHSEDGSRGSCHPQDTQQRPQRGESLKPRHDLHCDREGEKPERKVQHEHMEAPEEVDRLHVER